MPLKSIAAHYDGNQVLFDEQVDIRAHTRLIVTILENDDPEREGFLAFASAAFADSFGEDEIEYNEADLVR